MKKIKIKKIKISKLSNPRSIIGGTDNHGDTLTETVLVNPPKCKENSRVWEQQ